MKKYLVPIIILFILFSLYLQLLGLMNLVPLIVSAPVLFLSLLILVSFLNSRKRFRGFK